MKPLDLNSDDLLSWIAKESRHHWQTMQDNVTNNDVWLKNRGAYDLLEKLRMHVLMQANRHNREDIRKFNER